MAPLVSEARLLGSVLEVRDMTEALLILVKVSVGVLILAIGMGATVADLTYVLAASGIVAALLAGHVRAGALVAGVAAGCAPAATQQVITANHTVSYAEVSAS